MRIAAAIAFIITTVAFAGDAPRSYADAEAIWKRNRSKQEYQKYATAFSEFNNHFRLDEKSGCYALASGPVNLMLVISHPKNSEFAVIEQVFSDVDNAKARCFKKTYGGVRTKVPPYLPFVLQMGMAG